MFSGWNFTSIKIDEIKLAYKKVNQLILLYTVHCLGGQSLPAEGQQVLPTYIQPQKR